MTTDNAEPTVLILGASQVVVDEAATILRDLGYTAQATNDFADITGRFDPTQFDLVVLGGRVPPPLKAEIQAGFAAANPTVMFVQGLAGIPGLIADMVQGAFAAEQEHPDHTPTYTPHRRTIALTLATPANVKVTAYWTTSTVPPDPKSTSLVLLDDRLAAGDHTIQIPDHIPSQRAFATVYVDEAVNAFSIATEQ